MAEVNVPTGKLRYIRRDINDYEVNFIPDHPWLNDIRSYAQMLDGLILIPHKVEEVHFNHSIPKQDGNIIYLGKCDVCIQARKSQRAYVAR